MSLLRCWELSMNRMFDEELYRVAAETIESLALMFLMTEEDACVLDPEDVTVAHVDFTGPFNGSLALSVTEELLPELAANMLGRPGEQDVPVEDQEDALKELANVICGNILPVVAGTEAVFNVCGPQIAGEDEDASVREGYAPAASTEFFIEGGIVSVSFHVSDLSALMVGEA